MMATIYLCDICKLEVSYEKKITILGSGLKTEIICWGCWVEINKLLQKLKEKYTEKIN